MLETKFLSGKSEPEAEKALGSDDWATGLHSLPSERPLVACAEIPPNIWSVSGLRRQN